MRTPQGRAFNVDGAITEHRTEWPEGLTAVVGRTPGARRGQMPGRPASGFRTRLTKNDVEVGAVRWYSEDQVLVWSFPGLTEGGLDPVRLQRNGGWSFTPDMAWINIQSYAFHYFHSIVAEKGFVARVLRKGWMLGELLVVVLVVVELHVLQCFRRVLFFGWGQLHRFSDLSVRSYDAGPELPP
jgi:hypothetical protein